MRIFKNFLCCFSSVFLLPSSFFKSRSLVCGLWSLVFFVLPIISNAAPQIVLPSQQYTAGVYNIEPVAVDKEAQTITVALLRDNWEDTGQEIVSVRIDYSSDNGKTWGYLFGFKTLGGQIINPKTGKATDKSWMTSSIPDRGSDRRKIRGSLEIYSAIATTVTFDIQ